MIDDEMTEAEADKRAENVMNEIVKTGTAYESLEGFIRESKLGAKDLSVLKKRKQIAPEIRALLGQYEDPRLNFAKSATKMSRLIFNQTFLEQIKKEGMGVYLFTDDNKPPEAPESIAIIIITSEHQEAALRRAILGADLHIHTETDRINSMGDPNTTITLSDINGVEIRIQRAALKAAA
jgi:hypothetical protein